MSKRELTEIKPEVDPIEWLPGSLGTLYPRVEDTFCNAAAAKRKRDCQRMRDYKAAARAVME